MMKAVVTDRYGPPDVLEYRDVEKPTPGDDEILIEIVATAANPADWHTLRADPFFIRFMGDGLLRPKHKILGIDIAGRVEAVGKNVARFQPGDEVFGTSRYGGFAEYVCVTEDRIVSKPPGTSFEEAAAVPIAAFTALQGLRDGGKIRKGQRVLVNGASGGVGTYAVQIAKSFGTEVTGVCSTRNLEMVRSLGADHVVDYKNEDVTRNGVRYDLILDAAAYRSVLDYRRSLSDGGIYVMVGGAVARVFQLLPVSLWTSWFGPRMMFLMARANHDDLVFLRDLLESGKLVSVIDRRYPLRDVPDALRYLEQGHARGKVIISMG